ICIAGAAAPSVVALVHRHDGDDPALALARLAGSVAARGKFQLRRSDHRGFGPLGDRFARRRPHPARLRAAVRPPTFRLAAQRDERRGTAALCAGRRSAAAGAGGAQRLRALERAGAGVDADRLWLAAGTIRDRTFAHSHRAPRAVGTPPRVTAMSEPRPSEPRVLDQPWRLWASVAVFGILLFGVLLGILIIPIVQGRSAGLDAYTAICRALGILPGSPAQPQPTTTSPPTPVSQVIWTPEVLQILARGDTARGHAK